MTAFAAALWVFGSTVATQINEISHVVPAGWKVLVSRVAQEPYAQQALQQLQGANVLGATSWATSTLATWAAAITSAVGTAIIVLVAAIYLAAQPERYRNICLRLVPHPSRPAAVQLLDASALVLQRWLVGQLVIMAAIGLLSGIGLWLLGIEAAFALGLMGGLLCFIPIVGAVLAAVPAVLVAITHGPVQAGMVVLMYLAVHLAEGNLISPIVQAQATALPPVVALLSTVAFGILLGPAGLLVAAPLTLFLITVVEIVYIQQGLGDKPTVIGAV